MSRPSLPRGATSAVAALVSVTLLAGIVVAATGAADSGSTAAAPPAPVDTTPATLGPAGVPALDTAIPAFNSARAAVLSDTGQLAQLAGGIDGIAAAAATGDPTQVRGQAQLPPLLAQTHKVLDRLPGEADRYGDALTALAAAARNLDGSSATAIDGVVRAGRAELRADRDFTTAATAAAAAYDVFAPLEARWYDRAVSGWYRSTREAADAYAVFLDPVRRQLTAAQQQLESSDRDRAAAAAATSAAVRRAETLLASR